MRERYRIILSKKALLWSLLALLGLHDNSCALAETCFTNNKYPKFAAPQSGYETWTYSTIYSEAALAVFSGGIEKQNNNPWMMRVDTDTARVAWRRYVDVAGANQMVSAMSVESTGTYLAVLLAAGGAGGYGTAISLFVVRTSDGGHHT